VGFAAHWQFFVASWNERYKYDKWQDEEMVYYNGKKVHKSGLLFLDGSQQPPPTAADEVAPNVSVTWLAGSNTVVASDPDFNLLSALEKDQPIILASVARDPATDEDVYTVVARGMVNSTQSFGVVDPLKEYADFVTKGPFSDAERRAISCFCILGLLFN
jgi:hypothetical protein